MSSKKSKKEGRTTTAGGKKKETKKKPANKDTKGKQKKKKESKEEIQQRWRRRLAGGVLGAIILILFIAAMGANTLSKHDSVSTEVTCGWNRVEACKDLNCDFVKEYKEDCDECNGECNGCKTKSGGQAWIAFNVLSFLILLIGVIATFLALFVEKAKPYIQWVKLFYIIPIVFALLAVIAWVASNNYAQSCYDPDNDLTLGASNILDIVNAILLIVATVLVF